MEKKWQRIDHELPSVNRVVLGYSKNWIDPDFNPEGIRESFRDDDGNWISAEWNNDQDCWSTDDETKPEYWMARPTPPPLLIPNVNPKPVSRFA